MHCPNCGQKQVSNDTNYCSRCGFQLALVAELLLNGGYLPRLEAVEKSGASLFTRRNGLVFSLIWFLFFLFVLTPLAAIADLGDLPAVTAILGIFGGLILLLLSLLVLKAPVKARYGLPNVVSSARPLYEAQPKGELHTTWTPSAQDLVSPPATSFRAPDTGELAHPGSVTEGTTKLLKKEDE